MASACSFCLVALRDIGLLALQFLYRFCTLPVVPSFDVPTSDDEEDGVGGAGMVVMTSQESCD